MTRPIDTNDTLDTMALLFELSLGIGTSLDLKENCEYFFDRLLSRRNLSGCALFIDEELLSPTAPGQPGANARRFVCAFAHPSAEAQAYPSIDRDSAVIERLAAQEHFAMPLTDLAPSLGIGTHDAEGGGIATLHALRRLGFVVCIGTGSRDLKDHTSLNRFATIFEKFGQSIEACLDHDRLIQETTRRIELQERLARSERMESIGVLAGGIAHDLNNILGPLVAIPELVKRRIDPQSPLQNDLSLIESAALQAADVIGDLMVLARRGRPTNQVISLADVVEDFSSSASLATLKAQFPRVRIGCRASTTASIMASATSLGRVLLNLVSNSCEAIEVTGRVEISATCITVISQIHGYETIPAGHYGVLEVRDTGSGIRTSDLGRVFEPFFSRKTVGARSGTGLGLAIVYGLVKDVGGFVDIQTGTGGTRFLLYFPNMLHRTEVATNAPSLPGKSVLIVDDNAQQREMARRILSEDGYEVMEAATSESAMALLARMRPSVVVLDMVLGATDGVELYRQMLLTTPGLTCVLVSGFSQPERVEEGLALGAYGFVRKPFSASDLRECVQSALCAA